MSSHYMCYDIKGIQQFIFSVPRLKCIVGASGQIARFDENFEKQFKADEDEKVKYIFSGGGRGTLECRTLDVAKSISSELIAKAHVLGLDIRIGIAEKFSEAVQHADELYPFCPQPAELQGFPCSASGLFPVAEETGSTVHPIIQMRMREAKIDYLGNSILDSVMKSDSFLDQWPSDFREHEPKLTVEFLRNVNPESSDSDDEYVDERRAKAGKQSLGGRNRWAIIAMDGNDMGRQFEMLTDLHPDDQLPCKLGIVSEALKKITRQAFEQAFVKCLNLWLANCKPDLWKCSYDEGQNRYVVLPFRPLILGGDDLVLLCHSSLAMEFVRTMAREFAKHSKTESDRIQKEHGFQPFPSVKDGRLAISAGVLFSKVTLPLHTAIPYAESLLASAKGAFRSKDSDASTEQSGQPAKFVAPTPAAVDWDAITDTMIDNPTDRRRRELVFYDEETQRTVSLTDRPYELNDKTERLARNGFDKVLQKAQDLAKLPTSFRAELKIALNQVWNDRMQFLISANKDRSCEAIVKSLWEQPGSEWAESSDRDKAESGWKIVPDKKTKKKNEQRTDVLDAILLLDEDHRMDQELEV